MLIRPRSATSGSGFRFSVGSRRYRPFDPSPVFVVIRFLDFWERSTWRERERDSSVSRATFGARTRRDERDDSPPPPSLSFPSHPHAKVSALGRERARARARNGRNPAFCPVSPVPLRVGGPLPIAPPSRPHAGMGASIYKTSSPIVPVRVSAREKKMRYSSLGRDS